MAFLPANFEDEACGLKAREATFVHSKRETERVLQLKFQKEKVPCNFRGLFLIYLVHPLGLEPRTH